MVALREGYGAHVRALILGGSVFVGRRLVEMLVAAKADVTVLNRGRTTSDLPAGVHRLVADRTDPASMRAALGGTTWDAVFDVSGFVMAAGGSDIDGLLDLFEGCVGRYVFVSSVMAYDQSLAGIAPWTEDMPTALADGDESGGSSARTYGGFKALAESQMLARHHDRGLPVSIVRPAAIYGPHNNIHDMETAMFLRLLQGRPILLPHGGLVTGSYGHVDDLCAAMVAMVDAPGAVGQVFNVTAEAVTTRRYVNTLAAIVGVQPDIVEVPDDALATLPAGVFGHLFSVRHHAVLAIDKVARLVGARPAFDIQSGHRDAYEWFRSVGRDQLDAPLLDPVWHATWDFQAEAVAAAMLR
jgi:nucleoside-diphosphate-sugar epimerase